VLLRYGVVILRDGGSHTVVRGPTGRQSSVPRHREVNRFTARKIVVQLDLDWNQFQKEL